MCRESLYNLKHLEISKILYFQLFEAGVQNGRTGSIEIAKT
jgi:hypothetical protein